MYKRIFPPVFHTKKLTYFG